MQKAIILLLMFISHLSIAQKSLNLDFEYKTAHTNAPKLWYIGDTGYTIELDKQEKYSGESSLKMKSDKPTAKQFGVCTSSFPKQYAVNKTIEFKGKIKTLGVEKGYAGLWWRIDGKGKTRLGFDNMSDRGLRGDNNWTAVSIKMEVKGEPSKIVFGGLLTGTGTAWFDEFEVFIDGEKFEDIKPKIIEPTAERLAWLRERIYPLKSVDPNFKSTEDLDILGKLIGDAKILALGESTHGSREIFQMKHRIVKYLRENNNFDIFSIEANLPESYKVNEYVEGAIGNPKDLLRGMHFWTWQTEEVLAMIEWMKIQNETDKKIQFTGFDMQYFSASIEELKQGFTEKTEVLKDLGELKYILETLKADRRAARGKSIQNYDKIKVEKLLENIKSAIQSTSLEINKEEWLQRNLRIIEQYLGNEYGMRDKYMAENLEWIHQQNPDSKIVAWAHNGHVKKTDAKMGAQLAESLKEDYLTIGFTFHKGQYTATGKQKLTTYDAEDSYPGTYEYVFQALNEPIFLIDLRTLNEDTSKHGQWLKEVLEFRQVGAVKPQSEFRITELLKDFDMLIFINESSNSKLLR